MDNGGNERAHAAVLVDSTACLSRREADTYGIHIIPQTVIWERPYRDQEEISIKEIVSSFDHRHDHPKTSQASPGEFAALFEMIGNAHKPILALVVSGELSGTYNSAIQAIGLVQDLDIRVVDTRTTGPALGLVAKRVANIVRQVNNPQDLYSEAKRIAGKANFAFVVPTLEHLARGGRISKYGYLRESTMKMRHIFSIQDGRVTPMEQARTRRQSIRHLLDQIANTVNPAEALEVSITEIEAKLLAEELASAVADTFPRATISHTECSPVLAVHSGPGAVGIGWLSD